MKRGLLVLCVLLCVIFGLSARRVLPGDGTRLTEEKYESWSGVIRVWAARGANVGGISPVAWLNDCASRLEKQHSGVYFHIQTVPDEALTDQTLFGKNPPDLIVYPAGLLESGAGLEAACPESDLRADAVSAAVPLVVSPCFLVYRSSVFARLPADLSGVTVACPPERLNALCALCSGLRAEEGVEEALPGLDLGLTGNPRPTLPPEGNVRCRVGDGLQISEDALGLFASGEADVLVAGIADLPSLGRLTDWSAALPGRMVWAEKALVCSIVKKEGPAERNALCRDLISYLLGEGQKTAARAGGFPVSDGTGAWAQDAVMGVLEAGMEGKKCACPPFFGKEPEGNIAQQYIEGIITADDALSLLLLKRSGSIPGQAPPAPD